MEYAFAFVTLGFGGALLLYAILLRLTLDVKMIPRSWGVKMKDPKNYARTIAHIIAFLALALDREKDARRLLLLTGLFMLTLSPLLLFHISFQLSFAATAMMKLPFFEGVHVQVFDVEAALIVVPSFAIKV